MFSRTFSELTWAIWNQIISLHNGEAASCHVSHNALKKKKHTHTFLLFVQAYMFPGMGLRGWKLQIHLKSTLQDEQSWWHWKSAWQRICCWWMFPLTEPSLRSATRQVLPSFESLALFPVFISMFGSLGRNQAFPWTPFFVENRREKDRKTYYRGKKLGEKAEAFL